MLVQLRLRAVALVAASALLVAGCGGAYPGAAADLDGYRIPMRTVDEQAAALCALGPALLVQGTAEGDKVEGRTFRSLVMSWLVRLRQAELAAAELGIEVPAAEATVEDLTAVDVPIDDLSHDELDGLLDFYDDITRTQALTNAVLQRFSNESSAGEQAIQREARDFLDGQIDDARIDPRIGLDEELLGTVSSGSVSVPVSETAQGPSGEDPAELQSFVSDLPAGQSCG